MPAESGERQLGKRRMDLDTTSHIHPVPAGRGLVTRMREATGTVYGDIGTSVLYTVMEITRETIRLKHSSGGPKRLDEILETGGLLVTPREALGGLSLVF